jgi:hypothetical protein
MEASVETAVPYVLTDPAGRVLAWMNPHSDRIGNTNWPRNEAAGLSAHLTDDPNTYGDTSVEAVVGYLAELVGAGFIEHAADGTYNRTARGDEVLGGVCYADEVAAGRLVAQEDGTHVAAAAAAPADA